MYYSAEQIEKIQKIEIDILKEVVRICEENDIKYFTVGGTTLGAIRHNGFIPWDDDIDVGMMRDDYEKFITIASEQLREGYTIQHYRTNKKVPWYHAKVMKTGTLFVEKCVQHIDTERGLFVDIMPFDYIPEDEASLKKYRRNVFFWRQVFITKSILLPSSFMSTWKTIVLTGFRCMFRILILPCSKERAYNKLQAAITKYNSSGSKRVSSRGHQGCECDFDDIFSPVEHDFSGLKVRIPKNYECILRNMYGDYMKLPPEDKRIGHAPEVLDFGELE